MVVLQAEGIDRPALPLAGSRLTVAAALARHLQAGVLQPVAVVVIHAGRHPALAARVPLTHDAGDHVEVPVLALFHHGQVQVRLRLFAAHARVLSADVRAGSVMLVCASPGAQSPCAARTVAAALSASAASTSLAKASAVRTLS